MVDKSGGLWYNQKAGYVSVQWNLYARSRFLSVNYGIHHETKEKNNEEIDCFMHGASDTDPSRRGLRQG